MYGVCVAGMPGQGCGCAHQKVQAEHVQEGPPGGAGEEEGSQGSQSW